MAEYSAQIPITGDTYVYMGFEGLNFGTEKYLEVGGQRTDYGGYPTYRSYTLLKWDPTFPQIPTGKRIISAKFYIYKENMFQMRIIKPTYQPDFDEMSTKFQDIFPADTSEYSIVAETSNLGYIELGIGVTENGGHVMITTDSGDTSPEKTYKFSSRESELPPYWHIVYEDVPPDKPTLIDPVSVYRDIKSVIRFRWQYNSRVGGVQKKYNLQWSDNNGLTWTTISKTTANTYYDMPANTLLSGNIIWRVRTYNEYDEVSEYSDTAAFFAMGAPLDPSIFITKTNSAKPTIKWTADSQQVYQIQVLQNSNVVYDTGNVASLLMFEHTVKQFLADGSYIARVRTKNEYDLWSSWVQTSFVITTAKPSKADFGVYNTKHGLLIMLTAIPANIAYMLIYRAERSNDNYTCIAKLGPTEQQYEDLSVRNRQEYKYFIRAVTSTETYSDSDIKLGEPEFRYSLIAPVSDLTDVIELRYTKTVLPDRKQDMDLYGEQRHYSGRKYPVTEFREFISNILTVATRFRSFDEFNRLIQLIDKKETVLFRDRIGRKIYGSVLSFQAQENNFEAIDVSFALNEVDYDENVEV